VYLTLPEQVFANACYTSGGFLILRRVSDERSRTWATTVCDQELMRARRFRLKEGA